MSFEIRKDFAHGLMYELIKDAPQNYDDAIKIARTGGSIEYLANTQYNLGVMYHKGISVPKSYEEALGWYNRAEREGHAQAKNNMGVMFNKGQTVSEDHRLASKLYREAAERGFLLAQYNLAVLYYYDSEKSEGEEVVRDLMQTYMWVSMAIANGYDSGNKLLEHVESQMSTDDVATIQRHTKQYWEANRERWEKEKGLF